MKKIILSAMVCAISAVSFAQQGVFEVGGAVSVNTRSEKINDGESVDQSAFSVVPSFMYGISDKISIGAGIGFAYQKDANEDKTSLFLFQPTVRYTLPITEKFAYAPQFYVGAGFGSINYNDEDENSDIFGLEAGFNLVRFSYAFSPKIGASFSCGDLKYRYSKISTGNIDEKTNSFNLGINLAPTIGFYYNF